MPYCIASQCVISFCRKSPAPPHPKPTRQCTFLSEASSTTQLTVLIGRSLCYSTSEENIWCLTGKITGLRSMITASRSRFELHLIVLAGELLKKVSSDSRRVLCRHKVDNYILPIIVLKICRTI